VKESLLDQQWIGKAVVTNPQLWYHPPEYSCTGVSVLGYPLYKDAEEEVEHITCVWWKFPKPLK